MNAPRIPLSVVQELADELTLTDFAAWRPLPAAQCQVYESEVDVFGVYCVSLILLDAISIPTIAEYCDEEHRVSLKLLAVITLCSYVRPIVF